MHMADALISPAVGGTMWAATAALIGYSSKRLSTSLDDRRIPLMGVLGAFIFAAQMINFAIPGTGSSGHLGGGMILAVLLGPCPAFLVMASVLTVQSLFFADGGLLALGCNVFNLGFFPCFVAYPFLYKAIAGKTGTRGRILAGSMAGAVSGLLMGAAGVVVQTTLSGISELPFTAFLGLMLPIHLAIGVVEGLVTAAVISFVLQARPELLAEAPAAPAPGRLSARGVVTALALAALVTGGVLSWFAASDPDGLEWSMARVSGKEEMEAPADGVHALLASVQEKLAFLPDYGFKKEEAPAGDPAPRAEEAWPKVEAGTSLSGILGGGLTLLASLGLGYLLRRRNAEA